MIYQEYRCSSCKKLLFKGILVDSEVEVKCRGCGNISMHQGISKEKMLCYKVECPHRVGLPDIKKEQNEAA